MDPATSKTYPLPLRDALPIGSSAARIRPRVCWANAWRRPPTIRSEEHTSELQSLRQLVCRLLLEKRHTRKKLNRLRGIILSIPITADEMPFYQAQHMSKVPFFNDTAPTEIFALSLHDALPI